MVKLFLYFRRHLQSIIRVAPHMRHIYLLHVAPHDVLDPVHVLLICVLDPLHAFVSCGVELFLLTCATNT